MNEVIRTVYAELDDMTFIFKDWDDGLGHHELLVGWYYGEPDEQATMLYNGSLEALFTDEIETESEKEQAYLDEKHRQEGYGR